MPLDFAFYLQMCACPKFLQEYFVCILTMCISQVQINGGHVVIIRPQCHLVIFPISGFSGTKIGHGSFGIVSGA